MSSVFRGPSTLVRLNPEGRAGARFIESSSKIHGSTDARDPQCVEDVPVSSPIPASETVRGACGHDCPDTCSWIVEVREGTAQTLTGDPAHPFTRGTLCAKVNHYLERVYHPERVLHPLKRV